MGGLHSCHTLYVAGTEESVSITPACEALCWILAGGAPWLVGSQSLEEQSCETVS